MPISRSSLCALTLGLLLVGASGGSRSYAADTAATNDPYLKAVADYVNAAQKEVAALRDRLVAAEKEGKKERFADASAALEKCAKLVEQLRHAGQGKFDPLKASYEVARADFLGKLAEARTP